MIGFNAKKYVSINGAYHLIWSEMDDYFIISWNDNRYGYILKPIPHKIKNILDMSIKANSHGFSVIKGVCHVYAKPKNNVAYFVNDNGIMNADKYIEYEDIGEKKVCEVSR